MDRKVGWQSSSLQPAISGRTRVFPTIPNFDMNISNFLSLLDSFITKHGAEVDLLLDEGYFRTQFRRFVARDIEVDVELGLKKRIGPGVYDAWILKKFNDNIEISQKNGNMQIAGLGSHDVKIIYRINGEITPIAVELKGFSDIGANNSKVNHDGIKKDIERSLADRYVSCFFAMDEGAFGSYFNSARVPKDKMAKTIQDFLKSTVLPYNSVPEKPEWRAQITNSFFGKSMAVAVRRSEIDNVGSIGPKVRYWMYVQRADLHATITPTNYLANSYGEKILPPIL